MATDQWFPVVSPVLRRDDLFNRRQILTMAAIGVGSATHSFANLQATAKRRFTMDLCPGRIGVGTDQRETIELAAKYGFESVEPKEAIWRSFQAMS